jgi:hypothetical protein
MTTLDHYTNKDGYLNIIRSIDYKHIAKFIDINLMDNIYYLKLEIDRDVNFLNDYIIQI